MDFKDLTAYKKAFQLAMDIYKLIKIFPVEEKYGLSSQVRNSSRSVCASIAEGYRKRLYPKHFISKTSDADSENGETQVWLEFALACEYIDKEKYNELMNKSLEIGKLLNHMIINPVKYSSNDKSK